MSKMKNRKILLHMKINLYKYYKINLFTKNKYI